MKRRSARLAVLLSLVVATAGLVATTVAAKPTGSSNSLAGGTYRVGWESSFGFVDGFDPTGEYLGEAWAVHSSLITRTLVGYNHVAGAAGNKLVPDLATSVPKPTNGGKTYTFKLKSGIRFAPPVSRDITAKDIKYAMERIADPGDGAQYAFYYPVIKGWDAYAKGKAKSISGITTPNAKTLVINLTVATGDFLFRMAMPATGPIPAEVANCFESKPGQYGRNIVSSGPYMFEGSDQVNIGSCSSIKPASGFDGQTKMILVRNPEYKASTDSKAARENLPDRFEFLVNANTDDIYAKVRAGELEDEIASEPPKIIREYTTNSSLNKYFKQGQGDRTWFLPMTMTQPPFDDIHVRKAMNWVMDKDALRKSWGGPTVGEIATHVIPNALLNDALIGYDPYKTAGSKGDVAKAKAEMKKSKYDANKDGTCDADACSAVTMVIDTRGVDAPMATVAIASAKKIGITLKPKTIKGAYPTIQTPSNNVPFSTRPGWGKDYGDAYTFFASLFDGRTILKAGNYNYPLVGLTPSMAKSFGIKGSVNNVPSVDKDLDKCNPQSGSARVSCYAKLDEKLMTQVVPWIPWLWAKNSFVIGPKVTKWNYDQFAASIAYAHVGVKS